MTPLMTKEQHHDFQLLRAKIDEKYPNSTQVFVPMGPRDSSVAPFRILFIGQAVRGAGWLDSALGDYDKACGKAHSEIAECAAARAGGFWQVVNDIVSGAAKALEVDLPTDRYDNVIGWSNLAKIGKASKNPDGRSLSMQVEMCIEQLKFEIDLMDPIAIVLLVKNYAQKNIIEPVFGGEDNWMHDTPEHDRVAFRKLNNRHIIWMNHPRNMGPKGYRAASVKKAIELIVSDTVSRTR